MCNDIYVLCLMNFACITTIIYIIFVSFLSYYELKDVDILLNS